MPTLPGFNPGQYYAAGSAAPHGMSFGTPRDYTNGRGGQQLYDPRFVRPLTQESGGTRTMPTQFGSPMTSGAKGYNGIKPGGGGVTAGTPGYAASAAGRGSMFTPTSIAGQPQQSSVFSQTPVFSPQTTARSEYAIRAGADRASNLPFVMKQFDRPGVSRGAGTMASAASQIAATQSQGRENAANQFVDDYMANQRHLLDAQMARERERLGLGNVEARLMEMIQRQQLGAAGGLLSMLDY